MLFLALKFALAVVLTELLTELAIKSVLLKPPRDALSGLSSWLKELFSCGYCFSVWAAWGVVFVLQLAPGLTEWYWLNLGLTGLAVHRLSNYLHNFNDKWLDKYYDMRFVNTEHESSEGQGKEI